jgi:AcrR family transcriptional regulator
MGGKAAASPSTRAARAGGGPDGEDGLARGQVSEVQRGRILAAMIDVVAERGAVNATVARVVARSGVSRRTFYELFEDREECFLTAFDEAVGRIATVVAAAYERPGPWCAKVRAALTALLELIEREPSVGRLLVVEALGAGPAALQRRQAALAPVIAAVDQGRAESKRGEGLPALVAEGIVGGVFSLVHARLLEDPGAPLLELLGPLMASIVLPYLGPTAARRELERPVPAAHNGARKTGTDPLRDLDMRLTYRTIRVLLAIEPSGQEAAPSNRQVADAAGIRDQGQISKLLARLEHLGLIENASDPRAKGESNKWRLTQRGSEVREALSV